MSKRSVSISAIIKDEVRVKLEEHLEFVARSQMFLHERGPTKSASTEITILEGIGKVSMRHVPFYFSLRPIVRFRRPRRKERTHGKVLLR